MLIRLQLLVAWASAIVSVPIIGLWWLALLASATVVDPYWWLALAGACWATWLLTGLWTRLWRFARDSRAAREEPAEQAPLGMGEMVDRIEWRW